MPWKYSRSIFNDKLLPLFSLLLSPISLYLIRFYDTTEIFLLDDVATFSNEILVASLLLRFHRGESMGFEILWSFHPRIPGHDPDRCRPYNPRPRSSLLRRVHLTKRHLRTEFIRTERYAFDRLGKLNVLNELWQAIRPLLTCNTILSLGNILSGINIDVNWKRTNTSQLFLNFT